MSKFSPAQYLRGLGWGGPGEGLNDSPHARAKPVTVAQKKTLSGVGKDRDTAFPWWEMVFATVASKAASGEKANHHRTTTGIISHLPAPKASAYASMDPVAMSTGGLLGEAKREAARRQLYSGFHRASVIAATNDEDEEAAARTERERVAVVPSAEDEDRPKKKKAKRERAAAAEDAGVLVALADTIPFPTLSALPTPELSDAPSERRKKKRKAAQSADGPQHLSPEEARVVDEATYTEAREIARRAAKEERRLERVVRRALRDEERMAGS